MSWRKNNPSGTYVLPTEKQILSEIEEEQLEINRIQKQRDLTIRLQESFTKKEQEIERLSELVEKYRPYYEQCSAMRLQLGEKDSANRAYAKENQLLKREFEQLLMENEQLSTQLRTIQLQKQVWMRERHSIERVNREIEETFKQYQIQCRRREQECIKEIEQSRKQTVNLQNAIEEMRNGKEAYPDENSPKAEELKTIQLELADKERQLQRAQELNHKLSVEFDKSVNKICEFQRELNNYRMQNHELKKTLGLVLEQDKYQKLHQKYQRKKDSPDKFQDSQEEQDSDIGSSPQMSQIKF